MVIVNIIQVESELVAFVVDFEPILGVCEHVDEALEVVYGARA